MKLCFGDTRERKKHSSEQYLFAPVQRCVFSFIFGTEDKYLIRLGKKRERRKPTVLGHSVVTSFKV